MAAIVLTMWTLLVLPFRAAFYWEYYRELEMHHNVVQQLEARAHTLFVLHYKHGPPGACASGSAISLKLLCCADAAFALGLVNVVILHRWTGCC